MTGKMAIVGDGDGITVFKAAGVDAFAVADEKKARETIRKVAADGYKIIFITEELAVKLGDFLKRFDESPYPVVLPVPSSDGGKYGEEFLKSAMERALGVDVLTRN